MTGTPLPGPDTEDPADSPARLLAEAQLAAADATWTVGDGAAGAAFGHTLAEPVSRGPQSAVTASGGIRVSLPDAAVAIAYETPDTTDPLRWRHSIAFCLPEPQARRTVRTVLTELGPDPDALRPEDTDAVLFDIGRGGPSTEMLVRTADPATLDLLRGAAGEPVADGALADLLARADVHRVVRTAVARIEVYGARRRRVVRAHPPTAPIPDGWVPAVTLCPAHPAMDPLGRPRPFDPERHEAFQALLVEHGDPLLGVLKSDVVAAVRSGRGPENALVGNDPAGRATVAVAIRQLAVMDGTSGALAAWRSRFGNG